MSRGPAGHPSPVPAGLYSAELLRGFAAGEHEAFVAAGGRPLRPRLARALALADLRPGLLLVDIGSGRGEAAAHAARRGARVIALDYSVSGLAITRETVAAVITRETGEAVIGGGQEPGAESAGTSDVSAAAHLAAADATALPVASGSADRVLLLDVAEHLYPWQLALTLEEVRRILAPGGYVVMHTLPNRWALAVAYPLLRLTSRRLPTQVRSGYERAVHVNEQDPWKVRRALDAAGLASRVWVEEWTTRHAASAGDRKFPDHARSAGYPVLRRPVVRRLARIAMLTPARVLVANDIFALAWRPEDAGPPRSGRFRPVR